MERLAVMGAIALLVGGCASSGSATARAGLASERNSRIANTGIVPGIVDGEAAHTLVAAGITVVDVRTQAEFAAGHVPGAVNIPHDELASRYRELGPPSTPVLTYCKTGRRSGLAIATLHEKGFDQLYDLQSYDDWIAADGPRAAQ